RILGVIEMDETTECYFTFNAEHYQLLERLRERTGKDVKQLVLEAVELALARGLKPAKYKWVEKNRRSVHIPLASGQAEKTKKLLKGKLTPLAVAGLLALAHNYGVTASTSATNLTAEDITKLKDDFKRILEHMEHKKADSRASRPPRVSDSVTAAKAVRATLRQLVNDLEYFKKGSETERKKFRELVDPMEIGYVTSLMKALFD